MMLGIEVPRNFDAPLRSKSIIEFWQRWHISLTNFITTYLYTPILKKFGRATLTTSGILNADRDDDHTGYGTALRGRSLSMA